MAGGTVELDGFSLDREQVVRVARGQGGERAFAAIARSSIEECARVRAIVEREWLAPGGPGAAIYGFNTGVGVLKNRQIPAARIEEFQQRYIDAHAAAVGPPLAEEAVRAAILVRANSLASGHSGVRPALVEALVDLLNRGIHPWVPEIGSLGASGDLAQLAHVGAVLMGEPDALVLKDGVAVRLGDLAPSEQPRPLRLEAKEAMALTNGTSFMLALLVLLLEDAGALVRLADLAAGLTLEATLGEEDAFDARLQVVRGHPGQESVARNLRRLLRGGEPTGEPLRLEYLRAKIGREVDAQTTALATEGIDRDALHRFRLSTEHLPRVQDAYSLRCAPQVHGATRDALLFARTTADRELNAVTDNPLLFSTREGVRALSGGNFHGQPLALAADFASIALAELASISERRLYRLLNAELSYGLPSNLTGGEPGINTGLMITQYTAAALVSENKTLAHPASVDSIPTSGDQEDHVSMGLWAARKARRILDNTRRVLALEILAAVQGLDLQEDVLGRPRRLGAGLAATRDAVRTGGIPMLKEDRFLPRDLELMQRLVDSGALVAAAETALGEGLE